MPSNKTNLILIIFSFFIQIFNHSGDGIIKSILDFQISNHLIQSKGCSAIKVIATIDGGYVVAGYLTHFDKVKSQNVALLKFNSKNELKQMNKNIYTDAADEILVDQLKETANYYSLVLKVKNPSQSVHNLFVYRFNSTLSQISLFEFNTQCCNPLEGYTDRKHMIVSDDNFAVFCVHPGEGHSFIFHVFDLNTKETKYCNWHLIKHRPIDCQYCFLDSAGFNNINKNEAFFMGRVLFNGCPFYLPDVSDKIVLLTLNENFINIPKYDAYINPGYDEWFAKSQDQVYQYMANYHNKGDQMIQFRLEGFDIPFRRVYGSFPVPTYFPWYRHYEDKRIAPSSITSIYSNLNVYDATFIDHWFVLTGNATRNSVTILVIFLYDDIYDSTLGFAAEYPNPYTMNCKSTGNCSFGGLSVDGLANGSFIVAGQSRFSKSINFEWNTIIFENTGTSLNIVSIDRRVNNGNFEGVDSTVLKQNSTLIIIGKDVIDTAFLVLSNKYEILNESRLIIEEEFIANTIVASELFEFYIAGYITFFNGTANYGFICLMDNLITSKYLITFTFPSQILRIILTKSHEIYGIANDMTSGSNVPLIFKISTSLKLSSMQKVSVGATSLNDIKEITDNIFVLVGQKSPKLFIEMYNSKLDILASNNDLIYPKKADFLSQNILLKSVARTYQNNIIAIGTFKQFPTDFFECIAIYFTYDLAILKVDIFGSNQDDSANEIVQLENQMMLMTGTLYNVGFTRFYTPNLILIVEKTFSESNIVLNTITETRYLEGVVAGYQDLVDHKEVIYYNFILSFSCDEGFRLSLKTGNCTEICGDNINRGYLECDNNDPKCCSNECKIIQPYQIIIDQAKKQEVCKLTYIINSSSQLIISPNSYQFSVAFSANLSICLDIEESKLNYTDIIRNIRIFTQNKSEDFKNLVATDLKYIFCDSLTITFHDKLNSMLYSNSIALDLSSVILHDYNKIYPDNLIFNFKLDKYKPLLINLIKRGQNKNFLNNDSSLYSISKSEQMISQAQLILTVTSVCTSIGSTIIGGTITILFNFLERMEMIVLFSLINIQPFPASTKEIIKGEELLSYNPDELGPSDLLVNNNTLKILKSEGQIRDNTVNHPSLSNVYIFINLEYKIIICIIFFIIYFVATILNSQFGFFQNYLRSCKWNGFIELFQGLYYEFMICSLMQLFHKNQSIFWLGNLGNIFSFIFLIGIMVFFIKAFSILNSYTINDLFKKINKESIGALYTSLKQKRIAKYNQIINYLRRILSILVLFHFSYNPLFQSIGFLLVTICYIIWYIRAKPLSSGIDETINILIESTTVVINISFIFLCLFWNINYWYFDSFISIINYGMILTTILSTLGIYLHYGWDMITALRFYYSKNDIDNLPSNEDKTNKE